MKRSKLADMSDQALDRLRNERKLFQQVKGSAMVESIFEDALHSKRLESLRNAALGAVHAGNLAIHAIGAGYAALNASQAKHGIKQVDRLLSNDKLVVWDLFKPWVRFVASGRKELVISLDWTDFDKDSHTTLAAYLASSHGRSSPLVWMTVKKTELKDQRNDLEFKLIDHLHTLLPADVDIILLADRGFGDQKLYAHLEQLGWDYVIRFRENIAVENAEGESKPASEWVAKNGRATKLPGAKVTQDRALVPCVVTVKAAKMKDAWCLASSLKDRTATAIVALYGKRFSIEETFRDTKDIHFGMGLSATHIKDGNRRDRLMLVAAIAQVLLTLLGAASERSGLDRTLKANTAKKRTHSLFRQGSYWYSVLSNTREEWRNQLMTAYEEILREHDDLKAIYGVI